MGRTVKWLLLTLILPLSLFGQVMISGTVQDAENSLLTSASVIIKDSTQKIVTFGYTNKEGFYSLQLKNKGVFQLTVNALGYKAQTVSLNIESHTVRDVILDKDSKELKEVVIKHTKPVREDGDKVVFDAASFLQGNESVLEDLLKKIPGLNVSSDGTIKYGDQEVEKIMVEGDDFFEKGYKILTKNMPVNPINKVELLRNYSNNKHLKGIENSHKVALNLTLKDDHKARWFGNVSAGAALQKRFESKTNLMNFGKKAKYYFLWDANNTGQNASGDIWHLIRSVKSGEPGNIGDNQKAETAIYADFTLPNLNSRRTKLNNDQLLSLNGIFDIAPKTKLKTLLLFKNDRLDFIRNSHQTYFINNASFVNTEEFKGRKSLLNGFGKIELIHDFSDKSTLEYTMKANGGETKINNSPVFNGTLLRNDLTGNNRLLDHKILYTYKENERKVWVLGGRYLTEKQPQTLSVDHFLFGDLFQTAGKGSEQKSADKAEFMGLSAEHLIRGLNNDLWEFKLASEYRKDLFSSSLGIHSDSMTLFPMEYQNDLKYNTSDTYLSGGYRKKWGNAGLSAHGNLHFLDNLLSKSDENTSQQLVFFNPKLSFDWKVLEKQKLRASYSFNTTNAKVLDVYEGYIQTSYRTLNKGLGDFQQLNSSSFTGSYSYGSWSDSFFAMLNAMYIKNHDFFSTNSYIFERFSISEKVMIHDRNMFFINGQADRFINLVSSNLKLIYGFNKTNFKNIVNDSELREVTNNSVDYGVELRSAFKGFFNYHIGTKWNTNTVSVLQTKNQFTNNLSFFDLYFVFGTKLNLKIQGENYYFGNLEKGNRQFSFIDLEGKYIIKENKLSVSLICNNLLGTFHFTNFSISDISTSIVEYKLQPRYLMIKSEIRF
jgi:hypothetical protein